MAYAQIKTRILSVIAGILLVLALAMSVQPAYASTRDDLNLNYQSAVLAYESVVAEQGENAAQIAKVDGDIAHNKLMLEQTQEQLDQTAVTLYKSERGGWVLIDLLLRSESFSDAVMRYEKYEMIEGYYRDKIDELSDKREKLEATRDVLEQRRLEIEEKVNAAKRVAEEAALALLDNTHEDGAQFHQRQGVGNNCGATSFIVSVNTILHENRYIDNVAVWEGPGFEGDSTADLAYRGSIWLLSNGLFDMISIETVSGDIHSADEMRTWLEEGYVIVISSGSGSTWLRADGTEADPGSFPDGHWISFYRYADGVFYANDSSVEAQKGAGIPYDWEHMQQWLDGRGNHFATALKKR